jgi:long-chain fatty acid transport protein
MFLSLKNPGAFAVGSSGFENASYSAKTIGQANAVVARAEDPSTVSFNPAGIIDLPGIQATGSLEALNWRIFHRNQVTGDHNQNNNKLIYIPTFYTTINPGEILDNRLAMGVGVNSPFGLSSSFPSIGVGRYTGWDNRLKMIATTLAGSARLCDWFNIGGGAINYNIYDYGQQFNYPNAAIVGGGAPDGKAYTETSGNGWGWNLGVILKPLPKHKLAASYRSKATVEVDGRVVVEDLVLGLAQGYDTAPHYQSGAHSDVPLPSNLTLGYAYEPSEKWSTEFDFGFTWWEVFADQNFTFDRPNPTINALGTIPRNYDNTVSFHLGGHYQVRKNLDLLGGFAFYQAASPKRHVDNFLPDANRYLWTLGSSYKINDRMTLDLAYLFILFGSRHISNPGVLAKTGESIDGRYTSIINAVMVSFTYKFDFPFEKNSQAATQIHTEQKSKA